MLGAEVSEQRTITLAQVDNTDKETIDEIAVHFKRVIRCVENQCCHKQVVNKYCKNVICGFRKALYP